MPILKDLTGKKFGRLIVTSRAENMGKFVAWLCSCNCGGTIIVRGNCLKAGKTRSCGCLHSETAAQTCRSRRKILSEEQKEAARLKERRRSYNKKLSKEFGITVDYVDGLRVKQNDKCAICGDDFSRTPHLDHDHTTGAVRGLLCGSCNTTLGFAKDSITILQKAIKYLKHHSKKGEANV